MLQLVHLLYFKHHWLDFALLIYPVVAQCYCLCPPLKGRLFFRKTDASARIPIPAPGHKQAFVEVLKLLIMQINCI